MRKLFHKAVLLIAAFTITFVACLIGLYVLGFLV